MDTKRLTNGAIGPLLLHFAIPFLLSSLLQALYGAADLFVVGQFADSASVSAVAIGSQVMQTITGIVLGISTGGTVFIGQCMGSGDTRRTANAIGTLSILFLLFALILTPLMIVCTSPAVTLMKTPTEAISAANAYIFVCACGIPFIIGYNAISAIFRGLGDSKTPVYFIALACIINIVLDFLFVAGMRLGAIGAALATILAQGVSFIAALCYMYRKGFSFPFCRTNFHLSPTTANYILKVGFPLALQDALINVSFLLITAIINTMGLVASASVGVVEKIIVFAMLPAGAFSSAVAAMSAQNIGAGKPERATKILRYGISYSLLFGVSICIYSQFLPETLTSIFSNDAEVIQMAARYLMSFSLDTVLVSFVFCMNAYFSACGKSIVSLIHSLIATFGVRIPLSYVLSRFPEITLYELGLAAPTATLLSLIICFVYFLRQKKR